MALKGGAKLRRILKWVSLTLAGLISLIIIAGAAMYFVAGGRFNRTFDVTPATVAIPSDPASIEKGRYIAQTYGICAYCHGDSMAGRVVSNDSLTGRFVAPNLTTGRGGIGSEYSDLDFVRSIRHGVRPNGKPLIFMPSNDFYYLSDSDLGAVIAYLRSLKPVDNELPETQVAVLGHVFYFLGFPPVAAEAIDHESIRPIAPPPGPTTEYGRYLSRACAACHGEDLTGAFIDADLTSGGNLPNWTQEEFARAMRTGITPEGRVLNANDMPWVQIGRATNDELNAIWLFLRSLPAS